jgi:glycosyltransferase involved in cell wall biosynthesis
VVPVFNSEAFIEECLKSIINQTYLNIEIIIIDDGSTDNSAKIVEKYSKKDSRIKTVYKKNYGVSAARNTGISLATGEYVTFIDSDDLIHESYVSNLLLNIITSKAEIITTSTVLNSQPPELFLAKKVRTKSSTKEYSAKEALLALYEGRLEKGSNGVQVYALNIIRKNNLLFDTTMRIGEDFDFFARAIMCSNKIAVDSRVMYFYRQNPSSVTQKEFNIEHYKAIYNVQKSGRKFVDKVPGLSKVLNNNLAINSVSYGALMYDSREKYTEEFEDVISNIDKYKYSALTSAGTSFFSRAKLLITVPLGAKVGLKVLSQMKRIIV